MDLALLRGITDEEQGGGDGGRTTTRRDWGNEELTARIWLRILERSVVTYEAINRMFLMRLVEEEDNAPIGSKVEDVTMDKQQR